MFKFYRIPDLDTLEKIIGNEPTIKFSSAFNLNDPYELKFNLQIDPFAAGQREEFFRRSIGKTEEDFIAWQNQVSENYIWYAEQEQRALLSQSITLSSFTASNENNLMWSHYTDNHRGICVEYVEESIDFLKKTKGFFACDKVQYSDMPPIVSSIENFKSQISKMLFNKQSEWKYESEYRMVLLSDNNCDFIKISPQLIKAVYIGSKAPRELVERILELCKSSNIDIYWGITIGNTYKVTFEKYKEGTIQMRTFWDN